MISREISIIKFSFAKLSPIPDRVATRFYSRLFQMAPETRALFQGELVEQGRKVIKTLAALVDALDRVDTILPTVRALVVRHVDYGVEEEHYGLVCLALIETLREMLGRTVDGELEQACRDAYRLVATTMIEAARPRRAASAAVAGSSA